MPRPARQWLAVLGAWVVLAAVHGAWLAMDRHPPEWDYANHLERAVLCARDLARGDVESVLARSSFYPPLVLCTAGLVYRLAPSDAVFGGIVMLAFLGLGMIATYLLGRRFADGAGGVVAALLFGTAPFVAWQTTRFQLDVPLASMVALALEVLLRTEGFTRLGWSLVAGVVAGLGMLTKPPFILYVLPCALLALASMFSLRALVGALVTTALATMVALPWYGSRLLGMGAQIGARAFKQAAATGHPEPLSPAGLLYYPLQLPLLLGAVGVVLLLLGLMVAVGRREWFLLVALLPVVALLVAQNKQPRYALPLVPVAAVLGGVGFAALPGVGRVLAGVVVVVAGAIQVSAATFAVPSPERLSILGIPLAMGAPPTTADWHHRDILELIARDSGGATVTVSIVPNHPLFSTANFRYYAVRDELALQVARAWQDEPLGIRYMVLKTGDVGPSWTAERPRSIAARLTEDAYLARLFPVIKQFPLPDRSIATLRARRLPQAVDVPPEQVARAIHAALRNRLAGLARDVQGLELRLKYDDRILRGHITRVEVTATRATLSDPRRPEKGGLALRDLTVVLEGALVDPLSALQAGRLQPLDLEGLRVSRATITADAVRAFLASRRGTQGTEVVLGPGTLTVAVAQRGPKLAAHLRVVPAADRPFALLAESITLGGVRLPGPVADWVLRAYDPFQKLGRRAPFRVEVGPITVQPDAVRIGPE